MRTMLQQDLSAPHPGQPNQAIKGRSLWADARRRLIRNRAAVVSMVVLGLIAAFCFAGPWFVPYELGEVFWDSLTAPPSCAHWLGTDANGRDQLGSASWRERGWQDV